MGEDKAHVEIAGLPMCRHVIGALSQVSEAVVAAGRSEPLDGATPLPDTGVAHRGPLAGLAAAAAAHGQDTLVVVAVDQPWVRVETLRRLAGRAGRLPVVPVDGGVRQTTCAAYPAASLAGIHDELAGGGSIQSLLDRTSFEPIVEDEWEAWGEDGRSWFSVDTPVDIQTGLDRFGAP